MSLPRSVAEILREHVTLEIEGIDRMYLNVYVPQLQREGGVASFFRFHRGYPFASSVLIDLWLANCYFAHDSLEFLEPISHGQLTVLLPQAEVNYLALMEDDLYMFPRTDGVL